MPVPLRLGGAKMVTEELGLGTAQTEEDARDEFLTDDVPIDDGRVQECDV